MRWSTHTVECICAIRRYIIYNNSGRLEATTCTCTVVDRYHMVGLRLLHVHVYTVVDRYLSGLFEVHSRLCDSRRMIIHMNEPICVQICKHVRELISLKKLSVYTKKCICQVYAW